MQIWHFAIPKLWSTEESKSLDLGFLQLATDASSQVSVFVNTLFVNFYNLLKKFYIF